MTDAHLFEDTFTVSELVKGVAYDRVTRIRGASLDGATDMTLDLNSDLYPLAEGESFRFLLASTLNLDGSKDEDMERGGWRETKGPTLADGFDYVCYGKVYRFEEDQSGENIKAYVSFGGLLLYINSPFKKLTPLRVDHVYMLVKKI